MLKDLLILTTQTNRITLTTLQADQPWQPEHPYLLWMLTTYSGDAKLYMTKREEATIGEIPVGKQDVRIELTARQVAGVEEDM